MSGNVLISGLSSINTSVPFIPPEKTSIWSKKSFALWCLNIITAGLYTPLERISKKYEIFQLKQRESVLKDRMLANSKKFNEFDKELSDLLNPLNEETFDQKDILSKLGKLEKKVTTFVEETDDPRHVITQRVAFSPIQFFASLIYNLVSFGLYGIVQSNHLDDEVVYLKEKEKYTGKQMMAESGDRYSHFQHQIKTLHTWIEMKGIFKLLNSSPEGTEKIQLAQQMVELNKKYKDLLQTSKLLEDENKKIQGGHASLETARRAAEKQASDFRLKADQLETEKQGLNEANNQLNDQVNKLNRDATTLQTNLRLAQDRATNTQTKLERLEQILKENGAGGTGPMTALDPQLGPIPPKYTPSNGYQPVKGDFEDEEGNVNSNSQHFKIYKGTTLAELLQIAFNRSFDHLVALGNQPKVKVQFKNSYSILERPFVMNIVYGQMVYELLLGAKLYKDGCHGFAVKFNQDVEVGASFPMKVQTVKWEGEGENKKRKAEVKIVFAHIDELTPKTNQTQVRHGVDPVGAKFILSQLTQEEKNHLLNLLYEPLIEDGHPELIATRTFMKSPLNATKAKMIEIVHSLIGDMAAVIENRYKGVLNGNWSDKLDMNVYDPFFMKESEKVFLKSENEDSINEDSINEEADINTEHFENIDVTIDVNNVLTKLNLRNLFYSMLYEYQMVAKAMGPDIIAKPLKALPTLEDSSGKQIVQPIVPLDANKALDLFKKQYYISHFLFNSGCLFSNILASICSQPGILTNQANGNNFVNHLKKAMANYLDTEIGKEKFSQDIASEHEVTSHRGYHSRKRPMDVEDYQYWLRNSSQGDIVLRNGVREVRMNPREDLGNLELDICAHMLGVRFVLFITGEPIKIDSNGLMMPVNLTHKHNVFGPTTGVCIRLFNYKNASFYGLYPKLKLPSEKSTVLFEGVSTLNAYWDKCQKISLSNFN